MLTPHLHYIQIPQVQFVKHTVVPRLGWVVHAGTLYIYISLFASPRSTTLYVHVSFRAMD